MGTPAQNGGMMVYLDYILFFVGSGLLLAALLLLLFLLRGRKKSRDYRRLLKEETQRLDIADTLRTARTASTEMGSPSLLEALVKTQGLPAFDATGLPETEMPSQSKMLPETEENPATELNAATDQLFRAQPEVAFQSEMDLDIQVLEGKYELLRELHGGGMSRIFLARHTKLGNEWIVKFVERAELAGEAEVLKRLNHISLPQIIDIFQTDKGTFLVERYIEGYSLAEILSLGQELRESQVCDWGLQIAQVLNYLHHLETPIIHCDLKPSNIMVTYDDRLVLIDFGISKRQGHDEQIQGLTYRYAAPEQFQGPANKPEIIRKYFGNLPEEHDTWPIDQRTDLYSVGVILKELAMGRGEQVSSGLKSIIEKCLEIDPAKRFQTAKELANALERLKAQQPAMARSLALRRVSAICCGLCLAGGLVTSASAVYVNRMENLSLVSMDPGQAVVTVQQGVQLLIQKTTPSGKTVLLEPEKIRWSYSSENIAQVDGDRLLGLNIGETTLRGQYRNKIIELAVTVTESPEENTDIALRYVDGVELSLFAGGGEREQRDGPLADAAFVSPESMAADGEHLWITDSGTLRDVQNGVVETVPLGQTYWTAEQVRVYDGKPCVLTGPWESEDGIWYAFVWAGEAQPIYQAEADWSAVTDFAFSSDGTLWFIQHNLAFGDAALNRLDVETGEWAKVLDLPDGVRCMAFDEEDNLYISVPDEGVILRVGYGDDQWTYFAGESGARHFIDGVLPNFYRPTSLMVSGNALYVLDFDTVRKTTIEDGGARFTETLAGLPVADTNPKVQLGCGGETLLPASERAALATDGKHLLLSDSKNAAIYELGGLC